MKATALLEIEQKSFAFHVSVCEYSLHPTKLPPQGRRDRWAAALE